MGGNDIENRKVFLKIIGSLNESDFRWGKMFFEMEVINFYFKDLKEIYSFVV